MLPNQLLYHIRQWHWISSALCLVGLILFAVTGITLNRADLLETKPQVTYWEKPLPFALQHNAFATKKLGLKWQAWLEKQTGYNVTQHDIQWSEDEIYIAMPSAGIDAWISLRPSENIVEFEQTKRGSIAFLNDLHKGRNTGEAWRLFMDIFAIACIIFAATGLFLLIHYQKQRGTTWPFVATGAVVPMVIVLLFMHL